MVVLGRIAAPFGVRGWVHVHAFGDDPSSWITIRGWQRSRDPDSASWMGCQLEGLKAHGDGWIAKLAGVDDREAAESVVGDYLAAERSALPATRPDEYYWADLIGLSVWNLEGVGLGTVASLIETGCNPVLVVKSGEQERLLPFVESVIRRVDPERLRIEADWGADW